jgi:hypothetical protein
MASDAAGVSSGHGRSVTPEQGPPSAGKRRRPSGAPPPLPRQLGVSGWVWVTLVGSFIAIIALAVAFQSLGSEFERWEAAVLRRVADARTGWLTTLMLGINTVLASRWTIRILRLGTLVALVGWRRWRHLLTFLGSVVVVELAVYQLSIFQARPRPIGVRIIGSWEGLSFPSPPVAALAVTLVGMVYSLLPPGRVRSWGKWAASAVLLVLGVARMYLAVDRPTDVLAAVIVGVAIPVVAFRFFTPNPVLHPERGVPGDLPVGQGRASGRRWASRAGHPHGGPGAAGLDRPRRPAGRAGGLGRFHAASAAGRGGRRRA